MLNVISVSDKCRLTKLNSEDVEWRGGVINPSDIGDRSRFWLFCLCPWFSCSQRL